MKYLSIDGKLYPDIKCEVNIPKIIMQSWKTKEVPLHWSASPESIKERMPDWKYVLMDDIDNRQMVATHFPDFLSYYDSYPNNIQRADTARYCFLYLYGGIYMDLDFIVQRDLSPLFKDRAIGSIPMDLMSPFNNREDSEEENKRGDKLYLVQSGNVSTYFTNSFMASTPRNKFWLEVIEECKKPVHWMHVTRHFEIMGVSGPIMLSRVANATDSVISIIPKVAVMPCSVCDITCDASNSYLKPLEGSSWLAFDSQFYNFFLCNWKTLLVFLALIFFLYLLYLGVRGYLPVTI